jgi:hypothetical protein
MESTRMPRRGFLISNLVGASLALASRRTTSAQSSTPSDSTVGAEEGLSALEAQAIATSSMLMEPGGP